MRYKVLKDEHGNNWLIRDDGYRFHGMWLDGPCLNCRDGGWVHIAEYKHCDLPVLGHLFATHFMEGSNVENRNDH